MLGFVTSTQPTSEGWESIILSQVEDEKLAFDLFFQLWEQFKNQVTSVDHVVKI